MVVLVLARYAVDNWIAQSHAFMRSVYPLVLRAFDVHESNEDVLHAVLFFLVIAGWDECKFCVCVCVLS